MIGFIAMHAGVSATLGAQGLTATTTTAEALQKAGTDQTLMITGANGVSRVSEHDVQVIYGPQVEKIANEVKIAPGVS